MEFVDMHCDSLMKLFFLSRKDPNLLESAFTAVDFNRMKKGGQMAQFFAVYLPPENAWAAVGMEPVSDEAYIAATRKILLDNVEKHSGMIAMAYHASDIQKNWDAGKMSAVLTMEDGRAVDGKLENLKRYHEMGFRALSLTWNKHNFFGAPNSADASVMQEGLTPFGKEAVEYMQELGMLVDVSHLSEGGFYDVADVCRKPFVATHSNCRALCPHQRNLTDEQLRILGNSGGVAGLNFGPEFLNEDVTCKDSTAALVAKHARHMADAGGVDCVAIGTDFDGIHGNIEINDCSRMELLEDALRKEKFTDEQIERILYKNVLRVMKECIG